jgi:hypothetical protein
MTTIRKIVTSKIDGNDANSDNANEIRPFGELAVYVDPRSNQNNLVLSLHDGFRTHLKSKVLGLGVLYGSGADSGDGRGLDTIKLIPDAALHYNGGGYGNDQYLIVDPTEPDHIHLRAGGTIDNSNADLFLGGEANHVRVSDISKQVTIKATSFSSDVSTWTFDPLLTGEGTLPAKMIFPDGTEQTTAWAGGRVVTAPDVSTGQVGDRAGDLAFTNDYIYYCTQDYSSVGWDNTATVDVAGGNGVDNGIAITLAVVPSIGWSISNGTETSTINQVVPQGSWYVLFWDNPITFIVGDTVYYGATALVQPNIWRRVAWSADTW